VIIYKLAFDKSYQMNNDVDFDVGVGLMLLFQIIHLAFIIVTSIKLTKQVMHRTATGWFLAQSYLSTVLLFGGVLCFLCFSLFALLLSFSHRFIH